MPTISPMFSLITTVAFSISALVNTPPLVLSTTLGVSAFSSSTLLNPSAELDFPSFTSRPEENPKSA